MCGDPRWGGEKLQGPAAGEKGGLAARLHHTIPSAGLVPRHTGSAHPGIIKFDPEKEFDDLFLVQCDLSFDSMCFEFSVFNIYFRHY